MSFTAPIFDNRCPGRHHPERFFEGVPTEVQDLTDPLGEWAVTALTKCCLSIIEHVGP